METFDFSTPLTIRGLLDKRERSILSRFASYSDSASRRRVEAKMENDYRPPFSVDVDRILHSRAYTRYIDKTQVFYLIENDHITHRVLHVQLVSKIARTIGRFLGLNEDLIEAIALGHDIGHTPFGHEGEIYLSELCHKSGIGYFLHNVQSVQFLDQVERNGMGWNLCLETLDGILCHDGEIHNQRLTPFDRKNFSILDQERETKKYRPETALHPMTLEGCVVRMADTISYIGRDIEDAIRLSLIDRDEIPQTCVQHLGNTNGTIVFRLVTDIIQNSADQPFIAFSPAISRAVEALKAFNLERIYLNPRIKCNSSIIRRMFEYMFESCLADIQAGNASSIIFSGFLKEKQSDYLSRFQPPEIVRDYISGMTDSYFIRQCPESLRSKLQPISIP
jgi:dGTPase